jgi:hypothetical protein
VSLKRRNSRLFSIEKRVAASMPPPGEPPYLDGIELELLNNQELEELERAVKLLERLRLLHMALSPADRTSLREHVRANLNTTSATEYYRTNLARVEAAPSATS